MQLVPLLLIFFGESLAIYAEIVAAKHIQTFNTTLVEMSIVMAVAGVMLVAGYMFGVKYLQNIWVVGAVSIASIIIMEPLITYTLFRELPTKGALIGLMLGFCGLLSALFIK